MSEFEQRKVNIANEIASLCAHCSNGVAHNCQVKALAEQVYRLSGVPLIVNDRFSGLLFGNYSNSAPASGVVNN